MAPYLNITMCYKFCIGSTMPCLTIITRSLLSHQYNPFFKVYMGDYAELFPERIVNCDCKQTRILPVTQDITKCNAPGESFAMDFKTFARVSLIYPFGRHMPTGPTGLQLSMVYGCYQLAEHTVLASFQFDPGGYLSKGFVFDPGGFIFNPGWFIFNPQGLCSFSSPYKLYMMSRSMMGSKA